MMDANFAVKISVWITLTLLLGIFVLRFYQNNISTKSKAGKRCKSRLGKAMVNMERACVFGDSINFYEFAKYAIREAMRLPQGKAGLALTLGDIETNLAQKNPSGAVREIISEIYTLAAQVEENEDLEIDLKSKLEIYYDAIRKLNDIYGKRT
jgi:hypothetical protein